MSSKRLTIEFSSDSGSDSDSVETIPVKTSTNKETIEIEVESYSDSGEFEEIQPKEQVSSNTTQIEEPVSKDPVTSEEPISNDTIQSEEDPYKSFFCERIKRATHIRSPLIFRIREESDPIMYAKTRGMHTNTVYLSDTPEIHIKKGLYQYFITASFSHNQFILYKKESSTPELTLTFTNDYGDDLLGPRKLELQFPDRTIRSRVPKCKNGRWSMNWGGKFMVQSQKNLIIQNEKGKACMLIRKIGKETLQLEIIESFELVHIFAIAISSFLCKL